MNPLADVLSSKVKAELFRLLFGVPAERLHLRELARQSGLAVGTVRQELDRLARLGVVQSEADGNRTYYRANQQHPLYPGISSLVLKTVGVVDVFRETLRDTPVRVAFIYGSKPGSPEELAIDLDLLVIGSIGKRELEERLTAGARTVDRGINFYLLTVEQFKSQQKERDQILSTMLAAPRLFIIGDDQSLSDL
jgi:DNA-binding transcriptional ArsR family regulator